MRPSSALRVPVLLGASRTDRFAPFAAVEALAGRNPQATIAEIEGDHFDVYLSPQRERASRRAPADRPSNDGAIRQQR